MSHCACDIQFGAGLWNVVSVRCDVMHVTLLCDVSACCSLCCIYIYIYIYICIYIYIRIHEWHAHSSIHVHIHDRHKYPSIHVHVQDEPLYFRHTSWNINEHEKTSLHMQRACVCRRMSIAIDLSYMRFSRGCA